MMAQFVLLPLFMLLSIFALNCGIGGMEEKETANGNDKRRTVPRPMEIEPYQKLEEAEEATAIIHKISEEIKNNALETWLAAPKTREWIWAGICKWAKQNMGAAGNKHPLIEGQQIFAIPNDAGHQFRVVHGRIEHFAELEEMVGKMCGAIKGGGNDLAEFMARAPRFISNVLEEKGRVVVEQISAIHIHYEDKEGGNVLHRWTLEELMKMAMLGNGNVDEHNGALKILHKEIRDIFMALTKGEMDEPIKKMLMEFVKDESLFMPSKLLNLVAHLWKKEYSAEHRHNAKNMKNGPIFSNYGQRKMLAGPQSVSVLARKRRQIPLDRYTLIILLVIFALLGWLPAMINMTFLPLKGGLWGAGVTARAGIWGAAYSLIGSIKLVKILGSLVGMACSSGGFWVVLLIGYLAFSLWGPPIGGEEGGA